MRTDRKPLTDREKLDYILSANRDFERNFKQTIGGGKIFNFNRNDELIMVRSLTNRLYGIFKEAQKNDEKKGLKKFNIFLDKKSEV